MAAFTLDDVRDLGEILRNHRSQIDTDVFDHMAAEIYLYIKEDRRPGLPLKVWTEIIYDEEGE